MSRNSEFPISIAAVIAFVPWKVRNFISEHFPLLYHLVTNVGAGGNSAVHWDARLANTWDDPARTWPVKQALVRSLTATGDAILDVGCGNGSILRHLRKNGYTNLHGLEISSYAVHRLRGEGIEMHHGELPSIPLPEGTFDVVIASQVLEHVIRRRRLLKEIRRVMKPGARLFIFVPDDCLGPISEPEHVVMFNARSLRALLGRYFSVVAVTSIRDQNRDMPILFAHVTKSGS